MEQVLRIFALTSFSSSASTRDQIAYDSIVDVELGFESFLCSETFTEDS